MLGRLIPLHNSTPSQRWGRLIKAGAVGVRATIRPPTVVSSRWTAHRNWSSVITASRHITYHQQSSPRPPLHSCRRSFSTIEALPPQDGKNKASATTITTEQTSQTTIVDPASRFIAVYTCQVCETRSAKSISRQAYAEGVVLVKCDGCQKLHLFADHLGWFDDRSVTIEEIMKEKGMTISRSALDLSQKEIEQVQQVQQIMAAKAAAVQENKAKEEAANAEAKKSQNVPAASYTPVTPNPNPPPYRIVMFASSDFSIPTLHALKAHASELLTNSTCTIVAPADKPTGRGQIITPTQFKLEALKCGFQVVQLPIDINFKMTGWDLPPELKGNVDVGVVVSFGYMLSPELISQFPLGVINIHPSLLPRYRGSSPIQFALAHGDTETGVSIIDVHPTQIDGGNIISQEKTSVPRDATFESMSAQLATQGANQLISVLKQLSVSRQNSLPQTLAAASPSADPAAASISSLVPFDATRATAPRIPKSAGELLFMIHSPETLYRIWSACKGFTPSYTHFHDQRVIIHGVMNPLTASIQQRSATASFIPTTVPHFPSFAEAQALGVGGLFYDPQLGCLGVICASSSLDDPRVLYISELQLAGKKTVAADVFAFGYLDKRKIKSPNLPSTWKFTQSTDFTDFFGPKLQQQIQP